MTIIDKFFYPNAEGCKPLGNLKFDCGKEIPIYEISGIHAMVQLYGYAKYKLQSIGNVFIRGQCTLHKSCLPIYYRDKSKLSFPRIGTKFGNMIKALKSFKPLDTVPDYSIEPLLQHYGAQTRWVDLVDNIWIALWFGAYKCRGVRQSNFMSYQRREVTDSSGASEYMYLLFTLSDATTEVKGSPGLFKGKSTLLIDLRKSCPSVFQRPHMQHAILIRNREETSMQSVDMMSNVVAIAKIRVSLAHLWIGDSQTLRAETLFPQAYEDTGLRNLIECKIDTQKCFASIGKLSYL